MNNGQSQVLLGALQGAGRPAPGTRLNHARGLLVEGRFRATPLAARYSMAAVLGGLDQPVLARFSSSGADPQIDQRSQAAEPRGLAVRIGARAAMVLVGHSLEGYPASTPQDFLTYLRAMTAPHPVLKSLPVAAQRFEYLRQSARSPSFSALNYHFLHPYRLTAIDGHTRIGRLVLRAAKSPPLLGTPTTPDYLDRRMRAELARESTVFALVFTEAPSNLDPADISLQWDPTLPSVALGHLWLDHVARQQAAQRKRVFDPGLLPTGVAFAGDPMLRARLEAYRRAAAQRVGQVWD